MELTNLELAIYNYESMLLTDPNSFGNIIHGWNNTRPKRKSTPSRKRSTPSRKRRTTSRKRSTPSRNRSTPSRNSTQYSAPIPDADRIFSLSSITSVVSIQSKWKISFKLNGSIDLN